MASAVNVPNAPGVPPVTFGDDDVVNSGISPLTADVIVSGPSLGEQWGLFDDGVAVVTADSVVSFDYKQEWTISDYPVEEGAFASYDKVQLPFDVRLRFTAGSFAARTTILNQLAAIAPTTQVFTAVTPEEVYSSVTVSHYDYRRTARSGVGLLQVDVWCLQIQELGALGIGNASQPDGNDSVFGGTVQATPTPDQYNPSANL